MVSEEQANRIVKLNVGGTTYYAHKNVLTKSTYFQNLLEGDMSNIAPVNDEEVFIDRCSHHFESVLQYLRTGYPLIGGRIKLDMLKTEAEYYQLEAFNARY